MSCHVIADKFVLEEKKDDEANGELAISYTNTPTTIIINETQK